MKRILIIEDDPVVTNIYRHKYETAGYKVAAAANGEAGLQQLRDFKPDLVQLDLMVPKVNGVEIIKKIRAQQETQSLPIIVLSNCYVEDMVYEARKAGADRCISKARCSPKMLLDVVSELLKTPVVIFGRARPIEYPCSGVPPNHFIRGSVHRCSTEHPGAEFRGAEHAPGYSPGIPKTGAEHPGRPAQPVSPLCQEPR